MRKRFPCGHAGLGVYCHRCKEAERFLALAEAKTKYVTFKDRPKDQGGTVHWSPVDLRAEAKRLQAPGTKIAA
jgi:hypothetical protein